MGEPVARSGYRASATASRYIGTSTNLETGGEEGQGVEDLAVGPDDAGDAAVRGADEGLPRLDGAEARGGPMLDLRAFGLGPGDIGQVDEEIGAPQGKFAANVGEGVLEADRSAEADSARLRRQVEDDVVACPSPSPLRGPPLLHEFARTRGNSIKGIASAKGTRWIFA